MRFRSPLLRQSALMPPSRQTCCPSRRIGARLVYVAFLLCCVAAAIPLAAQQVQEDFAYPAGSALAGQGRSDCGWGGPWTAVQGDGVMVVAQPAGPDAAPGGRARFDFQSDWLRYDRPLYERWDDDGQGVWIGFTLAFTEQDERRNVGQLMLMDGDDLLLGIGRIYGSGRIGFFWPPNESRTSGTTAIDGPVRVVAYLDLSGTPEPDGAYLWFDPDPEREPSRETAAVALRRDGGPRLDLSSGFDTIRVKAEGVPPLVMDIGGIRIGHAYAEAASGAER